MGRTKIEIKALFILVLLIAVGFLFLPLGALFLRSFQTEDGISITNYVHMMIDGELLKAIGNSISISTYTAIITTTLAFMLAYAVNCTRIIKPIKKLITVGIVIPMLLPTITYGFGIIYSFGKEGLLTKIFGRELLEVYGFNGLLMGYIIYTLPAAFLLINNSFKYIDMNFMVVSKLMGDSNSRSFFQTIIRPLVGTIGGAFVLSFILSFTDFGIPASVGGTYNVVATQLYQVMLGAIPDVNNGSVIAVFMLIPAVFGVILLRYLEKFNFRYDKITKIEMAPNKRRDIVIGTLASLTVLSILSVFLVMFIAPFMKNYPYEMTFTLEHVMKVFTSNGLIDVYRNSVLVATLTAIFGTMFAYCAALIHSRSSLSNRSKGTIDGISMLTNTVPGMVLGLSYVMFFNGSDLKGTFTIIVLCNMIHFFTTPYLMAKNALSKMNAGWETTGTLMGDTWFKTVRRVILPNSATTIIEMFSYYFIHSMVTVSAIIFLVTAKTTLVASKIKELQHYAKFNDIFVLSLFIFVTNIVVKLVCDSASKDVSKR